MQDLEPGLETREIAIARPEEHVIDEQRVPRVGRDETDRQPVGRIRSRIDVANEQFLALEMRLDDRLETLVMLRRNRLVDLAPPDVVARARLLHDELVVGAAPRMRRRDRRKGT